MMRLSSRSLLHLIARSLTAVGLLAGLFTPLRAQPAAFNEACAQISARLASGGSGLSMAASSPVAGLSWTVSAQLWEADCSRPKPGGSRCHR